MSPQDDSQTVNCDGDASEEELRRAFLQNCAKFAVGMPPAISLLVAASKASAGDRDWPYKGDDDDDGDHDDDDDDDWHDDDDDGDWHHDPEYENDPED